MQTVWHHSALFTARIFTLVIVLSLVILPASMSNAKLSNILTGDSAEQLVAGHHAPVSSLLKNLVDGQKINLEADCEKKNIIGADNSDSCCSTFSSVFYLSDSDSLGSVYGSNSIAPTLERQLTSGQPEAPHRPPSI